jgi:hypothetical protein
VEIVTEDLALTDEPTKVRLFRSDVARSAAEGVSVDPAATELIIDSAEAPRLFEFRVEAPDGATLRLADNGAVGVIDPSGEVIGLVEAASATDARGRPVPTHYEVESMTIRQIVDHGDDTAHPVATYVSVSPGRFVYVRFNRDEVKDFSARGAVVGAGILMGIICGKIPIPWIAIPCAVAVGVSAAAILDTFNKAAAENKCVELKFKWDGSLAGWKRYRCG